MYIFHSYFGYLLSKCWPILGPTRAWSSLPGTAADPNAAAAAESLQSCPNLCDPVRPHRQQPTRLLCPWDSPGKSTGVGCHCLLHDLDERQVNPHLLPDGAGAASIREYHTISSSHLDPPGSSVHGIFLLRTLEGVAASSSRGSSWRK